jgi:hypothetical protein
MDMEEWTERVSTFAEDVLDRSATVAATLGLPQELVIRAIEERLFEPTPPKKARGVASGSA